jgi:DNA polymerase-3 subunit epsilon
MNLHERFTLTRPLHVFDTETTGPNPDTDRIVEIGFQRFTSEGIVKEWRSLINPGVPIPAESTAVHGISDEDVTTKCRKCKQPAEAHPTSNDMHVCETWLPVPTFAQIAPSLASGFSCCDYAGKNIRFDLRVVAAEMARICIPWSYADAFVICADRIEQLGEPRTLADLYRKHLGKEMEDAHQALADVRATSELMYAQLGRYDQLPRSLETLHKMMWPGWIDSEGKFRFDEKGVARVNFTKHKGSPIRNLDAGFWNWILRQNFNAEIKAIARNAKAGRFPQPPDDLPADEVIDDSFRLS